MSNTIEKIITLQISGYSRGIVEGTAYYDSETKKLVDWDYDQSTYDMLRNDMEVDTYDIPKELKNETDNNL